MGGRSHLGLTLILFIFITALTAIIFFQLPVFAQSTTQALNQGGPHTLEQTGVASVNVVYDELSFLIVIDHTADTMAEAYLHVERQLVKVLAVLVDFDLPTGNTQGMDFSMTTLYDYQNARII